MNTEPDGVYGTFGCLCLLFTLALGLILGAAASHIELVFR